MYIRTIDKSNDGNKYCTEVLEERRRLVKGVEEAVHEYIPKLRTEQKSVGCDGCTRYRAGVCMYPTEAEQSANKGGTTSSLVL